MKTTLPAEVVELIIEWNKEFEEREEKNKFLLAYGKCLLGSTDCVTNVVVRLYYVYEGLFAP